MKAVSLLVIFFFLSNLHAQVESFDGVTPPSLPSGWGTSSTTAGGPRFQTTTSAFDTGPNSVFFQGRNTSDRTMLASPAFFRPRVNTTLTFRHRFNLEASGSAFKDGGRLHVADSFFPLFQDSDELLSRFGFFVSGGYNGTISSASNALNGKSSWGGNSGGFITTQAVLPNGGNADFMSFGFALTSDASVISQGWWIDSITLTPSIDLQLLAQVQGDGLGGTEIKLSVTNPTQLLATNVKLRAILPKGFQPTQTTSSSGNPILGQNTVSLTFPAIPAGSTETLTLSGIVDGTVKDIDLQVTSGDVPIVRRAYGTRRVSFAPDVVNGEITAPSRIAFDYIGDANDACQAQPSNNSGLIVIANAGNCSITDKATRIQNSGGIAAIIVGGSDDLTVSNESGIGINIPVLLVGSTDSAAIVNVASRAFDIKLAGIPSSLVNVATIRGDQFDPNPNNNFSSIVISTMLDSDSDGTANIIDGCPSDTKKTKAGVCGCGNPDSDKNKNKVIDCLFNSDLKKEISRSRKILKKLAPLSSQSSQQLKLRAQLSKISKGIHRIVKQSGPSVNSTTSVSALNKLSKSVSKTGVAVSKANNSGLNPSRQSALRALSRLAKVLV